VIPEADGGWQTLAPSRIPFREGEPVPHELSKSEIHGLIEDFAAGARRALQAGFDVVELHGAHGYLMHEFLSPLSNARTDEYGGSLSNRMRFALEVTEAVRGRMAGAPAALLPHSRPPDWVPGGWTDDESVALVPRTSASWRRSGGLLVRAGNAAHGEDSTGAGLSGARSPKKFESRRVCRQGP
jgi:2,4-dienoyl-CoA reductase-like NADH-dependent reductase (Old Yellow Enzyme family)